LEQPKVIDEALRSQLNAFAGRDPSAPWGWFVQATHRVTSHDFQVVTGIGGENWSEQTSGTDQWLFGVFFTDDTTGWAVGDFAILHTTDGGEIWVEQPSAGAEYLYDVYFVDDNTGWIAGENQWGGIILHTPDGGQSWASQISGNIESLSKIYFTDDNDANVGWVVGQLGTILYTEDGGVNWYAQESGTANHLDGVFFTDASTGWAVGINGTILHITTGGITPVEEDISQSISTPTDFHLAQNYPNPFNPSTTIEFSLPHTCHVTLTVYNIRGQKVATLVSERLLAGRHRAIWQASVCASGVYLCRLQADDFVETKKMLFLK